MTYFQDNDVESWGNIDSNDADTDAMARLYVFDTVTKNIEIANEDGEPIPNTFQDWSTIVGEELASDFAQGDWLSEDMFDRLCGKIDALLPFFLENYSPVKDIMIWE